MMKACAVVGYPVGFQFLILGYELPQAPSSISTAGLSIPHFRIPSTTSRQMGETSTFNSSFQDTNPLCTGGKNAHLSIPHFRIRYHVPQLQTQLLSFQFLILGYKVDCYSNPNMVFPFNSSFQDTGRRSAGDPYGEEAFNSSFQDTLWQIPLFPHS